MIVELGIAMAILQAIPQKYAARSTTVVAAVFISTLMIMALWPEGWAMVISAGLAGSLQTLTELPGILELRYFSTTHSYRKMDGAGGQTTPQLQISPTPTLEQQPHVAQEDCMSPNKLSNIYAPTRWGRCGTFSTTLMMSLP